MFIFSWGKLHGNFKQGYEWAAFLVPVSLFFDVIPDYLNAWRYVNIVSAIILPFGIACFGSYLF